MGSPRDRHEVAKAFATVTQAGLSVISPLIIFLIIAKILVNNFGWTEKTIIFAIVFGVICGVYNMFMTIYKTAVKKNTAGKGKKDGDGK